MTRAVLVTLLSVLGPALAHADDGDPCADGVLDPVVTPVRERLLDAQRGACVREEVSAGVLAHALIDTPGFHGVVGGDLLLGGRVRAGGAHELSAQLRLVDYTFVQTAVNKVTHAGYGPIVLGAATGGTIGTGARAALALRVELPYTGDDMDTMNAGAQLAGVVSGTLAPRIVLHARLGTIGMIASSAGGSVQRLALLAGTDVAWHVRRAIAVHAGAEAMAGWHPGFDHLLVRAGAHLRPRRNAWRLRFGVGLPVGGAERTNVVVDLGVVVDR